MRGTIITAAILIPLAILAGVIYLSQDPMFPTRQPMTTGENEKNEAGDTAIRISDQEFSGPTVRYQKGQFSPDRIEVRADSGCILAVANESGEPLLLRLNPHREAGDLGFSYPEIPPHQSAIIDPRYSIENIAFHDHRRPQSEFSVVLGDECKLL